MPRGVAKKTPSPRPKRAPGFSDATAFPLRGSVPRWFVVTPGEAENVAAVLVCLWKDQLAALLNLFSCSRRQEKSHVRIEFAFAGPLIPAVFCVCRENF